MWLSTPPTYLSNACAHRMSTGSWCTPSNLSGQLDHRDYGSTTSRLFRLWVRFRFRYGNGNGGRWIFELILINWNSSSSSALSEEDEGLSIVATYLQSMEQLYSQYYLAEHGKITKSQVQMRLLLDNYRYNRPEIFHSYLRITPTCFDDLVAAIADDEVFQNNANNFQMPVEEQVAIALYHFGHYGNSASTAVPWRLQCTLEWDMELYILLRPVVRPIPYRIHIVLLVIHHSYI